MQDDRHLPVTPAPGPDEEGERAQSSNLQTEDQGEQVMQQGDPSILLHQGLSLTSATASSLSGVRRDRRPGLTGYQLQKRCGKGTNA